MLGFCMALFPTVEMKVQTFSRYIFQPYPEKSSSQNKLSAPRSGIGMDRRRHHPRSHVIRGPRAWAKEASRGSPTVVHRAKKIRFSLFDLIVRGESTQELKPPVLIQLCIQKVNNLEVDKEITRIQLFTLRYVRQVDIFKPIIV